MKGIVSEDAESSQQIADDFIIRTNLGLVTHVQIPSLVETNQIKSDVLEGIEEAFAYVILDDENEKIEFYLKMDDFDDRARNYVDFDPDHADDLDESKLLTEIIQTKTSLGYLAEIMFDSFEGGKLDMDTVLAFQENVDEIVPLIDDLMDMQIEDVEDHVSEIADMIGEDNDAITETIHHITDVQAPSLIETNQIKSDVLEGIGESFAYLITDENNEKTDFYQKMDDFEDRARNYIEFDLDHDEDVEESQTLIKILQIKADLVDSAEIMFESFESGELDMDTVLAFEENVDEIVPLMDALILMEIADIGEHVNEIIQAVESGTVSMPSASLQPIDSGLLQPIDSGLLQPIDSGLLTPIIPKEEKPTSDVPVELLFVQMANFGSFVPTGNGYILTLNDVNPQTVYFSDRPNRISGHMSTEDFVNMWNTGDDSFASDPPNAAITILDAHELEDTVIVELTNPVYSSEKRKLQYVAQIITESSDGISHYADNQDASLPESFDHVAVFIDDASGCLTWNASPWCY